MRRPTCPRTRSRFNKGERCGDRQRLGAAGPANWPIPIDLIRLGRKTPPSFSDESTGEQGPQEGIEIRFQQIRQHLYRRRRLDLRAVARGVLSGEADAGEGAGIRRLEADLDRDQRHLLRLAEAGELSQMGARGAGRFRVLGEGAALRHQPPGAGGGRQFHQAVSTIPACSSSATGSARCSGNSRRPRNSTKRISASSWNCCRASWTAARCAMWSRCATTVSACPISSRCCGKFETPVVFAEHGKYPAIADVAGDFVYARLQKGNDDIKTCYPPKQLDAWAKRLQLWAERRRARRPAARRRRPSRRRRRATSSPM